MSLSPLRVGPSGRYFQTQDGEPFLFFGANDALAWPGLEPLLGRRNPAATENYLRSFADQGVTILRVMLEYVHHDNFYFENPVGHFRPEMLQMWDDLLDVCEKVGLRILLTPWDSFWMALRFHKHPYNAKNGGPAAQPADFFTDEATLEAILNRWNFLIERYAHRAVIAAWDLWNEIHPHYGGTPEQQRAAISRLSQFIRENERRVQGWTRLQTVSHFGPAPAPGYDELIWRHPDLDFATTHIYSNGSIDHPRNTVAAAGIMAKWTRFGLQNTPVHRPFTDSEHGPIHLFNDHKRALPLAFDDEYERHLMWAHLCSGGAGSGMRWPARHPHLLTPGMKLALGGLSEFARAVDWNTFAPRDWRGKIAVEGTSKRAFHLFAVGDGQQVIGTLIRRPPSCHRGRLPKMPALETTLRVRDLEEGRFEVSIFDPIGGRLLARSPVEAARGRICLALPAWGHQIAWAIRAASGEM